MRCFLFIKLWQHCTKRHQRREITKKIIIISFNFPVCPHRFFCGFCCVPRKILIKIITLISVDGPQHRRLCTANKENNFVVNNLTRILKKKLSSLHKIKTTTTFFGSNVSKSIDIKKKKDECSNYLTWSSSVYRCMTAVQSRCCFSGSR